jgi:hypothetical protein
MRFSLLNILKEIEAQPVTALERRKNNFKLRFSYNLEPYEFKSEMTYIPVIGEKRLYV